MKCLSFCGIIGFFLCGCLASGSATPINAPPQLHDEPAFQANISVSQLDGRCLEAINNQPDQIVLNVVDTNDCVPFDQIGFLLKNGEAANRWKAIYMHSRIDLEGIYKPVLEIADGSNDILVFYPVADLLNYDLCLWKDDDQLIGWERTNAYLVFDFARNYQAGYLYEFNWLRDDSCE